MTVLIDIRSLCGFVSNQVQYNMESVQFKPRGRSLNYMN